MPRKNSPTINKLSCPILEICQVSPKEFVQFWEQLYSDYDEEVYRKNIGQPLTKERIAKLFEWKNGTRLSAKKKESIQRYLSPEERIGSDADAVTLAKFLKRPGGTIWRIFWLHLQHPEQFPIYDQHVHRALAFLLKWPESKSEIPLRDPEKIRIYLEDFRPFFGLFNGCKHRQVDRALWTFGRFLKTIPKHKRDFIQNSGQGQRI